MAYGDYKRQVKELLGQGSFPWRSVTQVKQKPDLIMVDYDLAIVIESAPGGLSKV